MFNPFSMASWGERELRKLARWVEREPLERDRARRILSLGLAPMLIAAEQHFEDDAGSLREGLLRVERLLQPGRAESMALKLARPGLRYGSPRRRTERLCANVLAYVLYLVRFSPPGGGDPHDPLFAELGSGRPTSKRRVLDEIYTFFEDFLGSYDTVVQTLPPQSDLPSIDPKGLLNGH